MDKKDDSSSTLWMILAFPVYLVGYLVVMLSIGIFEMVKSFLEICWGFLKMPFEAWRDRQKESFTTNILAWLAILGFILLCIYAITADIRSGGKYSREDRAYTDYLDDISSGAGVADL